jgi:hypothetical protein
MEGLESLIDSAASGNVEGIVGGVAMTTGIPFIQPARTVKGVGKMLESGDPRYLIWSARAIEGNPGEAKRNIIDAELRGLPDEPTRFQVESAIRRAYLAASDAGEIPEKDADGRWIPPSKRQAAFKSSARARVKARLGEDGYARLFERPNPDDFEKPGY